MTTDVQPLIAACERRTSFRPAFDRRSPNPRTNYGIHGVELHMELVGPLGATQFVLYTNWHLPHVTEELDGRHERHGEHILCHPMPADLGYHSPNPQYEWQEEYGRDDCHLLPGKCYYDGSGLNAEPVYERLLRDGDAGVWDELEKFYLSLFAPAEVSP